MSNTNPTLMLTLTTLPRYTGLHPTLHTQYCPMSHPTQHYTTKPWLHSALQFDFTLCTATSLCIPHYTLALLYTLSHYTMALLYTATLCAFALYTTLQLHTMHYTTTLHYIQPTLHYTILQLCSILYTLHSSSALYNYTTPRYTYTTTWLYTTTSLLHYQALNTKKIEKK